MNIHVVNTNMATVRHLCRPRYMVKVKAGLTHMPLSGDSWWQAQTQRPSIPVWTRWIRPGGSGQYLDTGLGIEDDRDMAEDTGRTYLSISTPVPKSDD